MKILSISSGCALILIFFGCQYFYGCQKSTKTSKINETWEVSDNSFKVKATAYAEENGTFVAGAFYDFQSNATGTDTWREIMTFRHDDPVPIPREQIRFVSDQIGYVFMGWAFAVTTNGGSSWSVWTAEKDLPDWE